MMKENDRKCFKCGSSPSEDSSVVLYRFPNPGKKNYLRCELWAKYCFPNGAWSSPIFQKKLFSEHRMLCHKHFEETSFIDFEKKKLHRHAAPCNECDKETTTGHFKDAEHRNEFGVDDEADVDQDMNDGVFDAKQPEETGPFSWQKFKEDAVSLVEKQCDDDVMFVGEAQLVPDLCDPEEIETKPEFSCNVCKEPISGFRYACVQCSDWDLCCACEARGEHSSHFVLRIPAHKTHKETQSVLTALRRLLESLAVHEDPGVAVIKEEVKTEDPLEGDEVIQEVEKNAVVATMQRYEGTRPADTGQVDEDMEPLDSVDATSSISVYEDVEYLESEGSVDETDSIPKLTVLATRQKRKQHDTDDGHRTPQKVKIHGDQSFVVYNKKKKKIISEKSSVPKLVLNDVSFASSKENSNAVATQIKLSDLIELHVDRNDVKAPQKEINNLTPINMESDRLTATHIEEEVVLDNNAENVIFIECPDDISLSVENILELSSLAMSTDANEKQRMTLDGQFHEVIDSSKELRVNITRLAEDEIRDATGPHKGKR